MFSKGITSMQFSNLRLLLAATLMAWFTGSAITQVVTATLTGAVMPGVSITATQISTGVASSTQSSSSGDYTIPYLSPGTYRVVIEAKGFKKFTQESVPLNVSTVQRVDATLSPGAVGETITVTSAPPALQ